MQTHLTTDECLPEAEEKERDRLQRDKRNFGGLREMFCILTVVVISWAEQLSTSLNLNRFVLCTLFLKVDKEKKTTLSLLPLESS